MSNSPYNALENAFLREFLNPKPMAPIEAEWDGVFQRIRALCKEKGLSPKQAKDLFEDAFYNFTTPEDIGAVPKSIKQQPD